MKCNIVGEGNTELLAYYLLLSKKSTFKRIVKSEEVICKNPELFRIKDFWVGTVRSRFVPTAPSRLGKTFVLPTSQFQNAIARFRLLRRTTADKSRLRSNPHTSPTQNKKPTYWSVSVLVGEGGFEPPKLKSSRFTV